ncbi:MAG: phosphoribosylaminoimidazolesuccinocarboxamide synthase [bacterium]|nr:phosphoribosylaminoimidazolesuccinocarboxamide synthase [bacterium]
MKKTKKIYEGQFKKIYTTPDPDQLILEYKDDIAGVEGSRAKVKSNINKEISAYLLEYLEGFNIPTHFIKDLSARDILIKRLDMIPVKIVMHNYVSSTVFERYGLEKGKELNYPIIEFFLKDNERQDPMINQTHIVAFNLATMEESRMIERMTSKINAILKSFFLRRNMVLVGFTVEYGRFKNKILLADEISPDTCHLWDASLIRQKKEEGSTNLADYEIDAEEIKNRIIKSTQ